VQQGLVYAIDFLKYDSWSVTVILSAALLTMYTFYQLWQHRQQVNSIQFESHLLPALMGSGLLLYCFYILRVGGDFMSGRFWATPFFLAVLLLNWWLQPLDKLLGWRNYLIGIIITLIFVALVRQIYSDEPIVRWSGIANERMFYLSTNTLLHYTRENNVSVHQWAVNGAQLKNQANKQGQRLVIWTVNQGIGMLGFHAGSEVTIVDNLGLSDSLLARLPVAEDKWRIGHYLRKIPQGYRRVHKIGALDRLPWSLAPYYQPLHSIITDPLFDWQRLTTILWFNLGKYDHYLEEYIKQNPQDFTSFVKTK
jgi:arabinofuranosyltransferase